MSCAFSGDRRGDKDEVSCLKWNLFRFGSETWITYLKNQHAPFFTVKVMPLVPLKQSNSLFVFSIYRNKNSFLYVGLATVSLSLWLSPLSLTADKINNLTGAEPAACRILLCFCCEFEVWKQIKDRRIWSRQENFYTTQFCFHKTGWLLDKLFSPCQFFISINIPVL